MDVIRPTFGRVVIPIQTIPFWMQCHLVTPASLGPSTAFRILTSLSIVGSLCAQEWLDVRPVRRRARVRARSLVTVVLQAPDQTDYLAHLDRYLFLARDINRRMALI
jgi:hypothetical protein